MVHRITNIQGNLSKTELIQRIQQMLQDAERAQQARQMISGDQTSAAAREQVANTRQAEGNVVREDRKRKEPFAGRRGKRPEPDAEQQGESPPSPQIRAATSTSPRERTAVGVVSAPCALIGFPKPLNRRDDARFLPAEVQLDLLAGPEAFDDAALLHVRNQ